MLEISEFALRRMRKSLAAAALPGSDDLCFRVVSKNNKTLTVRLAKPAPTDLIVRIDDQVVLALPKILEPFLANKFLDMDEHGELRLS